MKKEDLTNLDLDIKKLTDNFPKNDTDAFLYIRGKSGSGKIESFALGSGETNILSTLLFGLMSEEGTGDAMAKAVLNAALHYLLEYPENKEEFLTVLWQHQKAIKN